MAGRKVVVYYAWSRPGEIEAPLEVIENCFPTLFESRRMAYPRYEEELADPVQFDQSVGGFLDHIMKRNFTAFIELAEGLTGLAVAEIERVAEDGSLTALDARVLDGVDTLIIISFEFFRTGQEAGRAEVEAVRALLAQPTILCLCAPTTTSAMCRISPMTSACSVRSRIFSTTVTRQSRHSSSSADLRGLSSRASACPSRTVTGSIPQPKRTDPPRRSKSKWGSTGSAFYRAFAHSICTRICRNSNASETP